MFAAVRFRALFAPIEAHSSGGSTRFPPSWTHLCHESVARQVNVGQRQCRERTRRVLFQPTLSNLAKSPQPLDHSKHVFDPRPDARLVAVLDLLNFVHDAVALGSPHS